MLPRWFKRLFHQASISDLRYRFMFEPGPAGELVALDCETTGLDPARDEIVAIAAIRIRGDRILASERFEAIVRPEGGVNAEAIKVHRLREADVAGGAPMHRVIPALLHFVGGRPLVGYYVDFDVRMIDRHVLRLVAIELPNPLIEVSRLYYERKYGDAPPGTAIDLSFGAMLRDLDVPQLDQHDAFNDALMTAEMYLKLRDLKARGVRIARPRTAAGHDPNLG